MKIRNMFATPIKAVITVLSIVVAVALIVLIFISVARGRAESKAIGKAAAETVALKDAGYDVSQVRLERTEFEMENGQYVYDVNFKVDGEEYEYWVDAYKGTILARETEHGGRLYNNDRNNPTTSPMISPTTGLSSNQPSQSPGQNNKATISLETAKSIAVSDADLSISDVNFYETKLENDNGRLEYEIDFYYNNIEYDYTIDATTGSIISYDSESYQ